MEEALGKRGQIIEVPDTVVTNFYESHACDLVTLSQSINVVEGAVLTPTKGGTFKVDYNAQFSAVPFNVSNKNSADLNNLIAALNALPSTFLHASAYGAGETLMAGVYDTEGAGTLIGTLTFDAQNNPNALFIVRVGAAFAAAAASQVILRNGATANNVFWLVNGAPSLGASAIFKGTLIAVTAAVAGGDGLNLEGRLFSTGGAIASTNPTITLPVGASQMVLGNLSNFILFTESGAISNTGSFIGNGDINTGAGAITGCDSDNGTVYPANYANASASFGIYQNGVLVPSSVRNFQSITSSINNSIVLGAVVVIPANADIAVKANVTVGAFTFRNRSFSALSVTMTS